MESERKRQPIIPIKKDAAKKFIDGKILIEKGIT